MDKIDKVLHSMDSDSRREISDSIREYERTGSSAPLKRIVSVLRCWGDDEDEDDVKILLPDFMKKLR